MNPHGSLPAAGHEPVPATPGRAGPHSWTTPVAGTLLGLAIVLFLRRYVGINHDAVVYLGQALVRRWPAIFGTDLFFVHGGSQDNYTLLPMLLARALDWFDPATLFLFCTLASLLLFAAVSWYCLRGLLPPGQRYWAWLGAICLPSVYGKVDMFAYNEQFFTPRPVAEILCLFAIGLLARRRWRTGVATLVLAGLFHPLQAIAACIVVWTWAVMQDRRWLHALWLALPAAILAVIGIGPFANLLRQADPDWLFILKDNTPQLFLTRWSARDFTVLLLDAMVLAYCRHALRDAFGGWCGAALAALGLALGASLVLVDGLHVVLPAGLQLWRVHWLAHWLAMAGVAALLFRDVRAGEATRALLLAFTALLAWRQPDWTWLLPALLYGSWPRLNALQSARIAPPLRWVCSIGTLLLFASYAYDEFTVFRIAHHRLDLYALDRRLLVYPLLALGLPLLGTWLWARATPAARLALLAGLLCPLVALGAWRWDLRPPQVLAFERNAFNSRVFGVDIPADAQVLWGYDLLTGPWLVLRRASYFSPHQLSGQVFNRDMAMDGRRRLNRLYPLLREYLGCQDLGHSYEERRSCHISAAAMRRACSPGSDRRPDFLVLPFEQPQRASGTWAIPDPVERIPLETYRLYSCEGVMRDLARD